MTFRDVFFSHPHCCPRCDEFKDGREVLPERCAYCGSGMLAWPSVDSGSLPDWAEMRGRLCGYCCGMWCLACGERFEEQPDLWLGGALCSTCEVVIPFEPPAPAFTVF